jgi:hypothetical protein
VLQRISLVLLCFFKGFGVSLIQADRFDLLMEKAERADPADNDASLT